MKRRSFVKKIAVASAFTIIRPDLVFGTKANSAVRVGLIGCGNRGTAVISSMSTHTNIAITSIADLFQNQLDKAEAALNQLNEKKSLPKISKNQIFKGSNAYQRLIESKEVDAVQISTPAYAHTPFMEAAIKAGKHVYCEKPVATDVYGCLQAAGLAQKLNGKQSVVIGFQIRYASPYVEMVKRVQRGDIGEVINVQLYYFSNGHAIQQLKDASDDEFRLKNHYHFNALSGGILLDQGIHMLDVCNWTLKGKPIKAIGRGGNKGGPPEGDAWSNFQVLYQYPNDINVSIHSTQFGPQFGDVCCKFIGTLGTAEAHYSGGVFIKGQNAWDSGVIKSSSEATAEQRAAGVFLSSLDDADANKEKAFIQSIETGTYVNEIQSGVDSTLTAILGRESAALGRELSWTDMIASNQRLDPKLNLSQFDVK